MWSSALSTPIDPSEARAQPLRVAGIERSVVAAVVAISGRPGASENQAMSPARRADRKQRPDTALKRLGDADRSDCG